MKKFKEFSVKVKNNVGLIHALCHHAKGWSKEDMTADDGDEYEWVNFYGTGEVHADQIQEFNKIISIREFFKLTKEDVIIKPHRCKVEISIDYGQTGFTEGSNVTQDQMDRIKAIMDENNE